MQRMFCRILRGEAAPAQELSPPCADLLARLLNPNPAARLTVAEACNFSHCFIAHPPVVGVCRAWCWVLWSVMTAGRPVCTGVAFRMV